MKISEIRVDDSQTGYYWLQIFVKNQREAFALREQIFQDQEIKERIHNTIKESQQIAANSTIEMEVIIHNIIIEKLQSILGQKEKQ